MVEKFEDGKVYVRKGSTKPYEEIIEAAIYKTTNDAGEPEENLMLDSYIFDGTDHNTKARIYETGGSLETAANNDPNDFEEIGTIGIEYIEDDFSLIEAKPSYTKLETALEQIAAAKPAEFGNWHRMTIKLQEIAREVLKVNQ